MAASAAAGTAAPATPAAGAAIPRPFTPSGMWLLVRGTAKEFWKDRVLGLSAEAAFWQLLSLPPLMLAVVGAIGYFRAALGPHDMANVESSLLEAARAIIAPKAVNQLVQPALHSVLANGRLDVISIGFLLSLWSGSTAMATYVNTITIAYDLREYRSAVRSRLLALGLHIVATVVLIFLLPALVLGPRILVHLASDRYESTVHDVVSLAYWPVVVTVSLAALVTLYHAAVPVRTRWLRAIPGALLAAGIWVAGSLGLRVWLALVVKTSSAYGSLSAPIAVLLFFYVTALAVLAGAELNAEIDKLWPSARTAAARRVAGNPGAPAARGR